MKPSIVADRCFVGMLPNFFAPESYLERLYVERFVEVERPNNETHLNMRLIMSSRQTFGPRPSILCKVSDTWSHV